MFFIIARTTGPQTTKQSSVRLRGGGAVPGRAVVFHTVPSPPPPPPPPHSPSNHLLLPN